MKKNAGVIALLGGGEWTEPCRALDSRLLHLAESDEVLVVPTAAAFEHAHAQTRLRKPARRHGTAETCADHNGVVFRLHHGLRPVFDLRVL